MGDLLKAKIQQRPDKQQLVRQHILEDVGDVDRSLAERQRMLVKCRLADSLNTQLAHRPGPLELIKKNILHTDEPIERAVKGMYNVHLFKMRFCLINIKIYLVDCFHNNPNITDNTLMGQFVFISIGMLFFLK